MRRILALIGLLVAGTSFAGCQNEEKKPAEAAPAKTSTGFPRTVTDSRGHTLTLKEAPARIVSLIPSETEVLYALGASDRIVAVTSADDYPPEVKQKPTLGSGLVTDAEPVLAQKPDLVVAVGSLNQKLIAALETLHVPILVVEPKNLTETYASIRLLGQAVGADAKAEEIVAEMQKRLAAVQATVAQAAHRPKVLIMYGTNPIYTTGPDSFINDLITQAGGQNIVDKPIPSNILSPEEVVVRQPEVILCGKEMVAKVRSMPGWAQSVPAVRDGRLYTAESPDGTLIRPSPRLARGVEELARYLHPELNWKKVL